MGTILKNSKNSKTFDPLDHAKQSAAEVLKTTSKK